ncbi:MAG: DUF3078 domain-containing protein [Candidatus Symbiothrix sp.]|jgi:hypothetical protein|nr:DUF3078 domain-containing protein [Candidatus Symbiothrix sp.]
MIDINNPKNSFILFLLAILLFPLNSFSQDWESDSTLIDTRIPVNPYFLPVVFDGKFSDDISVPFPKDSVPKKEDALFPALKSPSSLFHPDPIVDSFRKKARRNYLSTHIQSVKYTLSDFPEEVEKVKGIQPNIFRSLFAVEPEVEKDDIDPSARFIPKRKYWVRGGSSLLQFSQNHISDNWYKGGVGNLNLLSVQSYSANYKKDKLQFNNLIEWKLSFFTNPNDTLRSFRLVEDLIRTYSDVGFRAFNDKWSYSSNLEVKTQLFKNYTENTNNYISALFSPIQVNLGILGMKYQIEKVSKKDKYKKFNLSLDLSPLSLQYTWLEDKKIDVKRYAIEDGKHHLLDIGSTLNGKLIVNFNRQVTLTSRLKYFTNYEKVIVESENELNISLNRFFSTRFYLYGRFDDSKGLKKDKTLGYVQLNELFSFGFNYKW